MATLLHGSVMSRITRRLQALSQTRNNVALFSAQAMADEASSAVPVCTYTSEGLPLHTGRPRLAVLGTGWAAARLLRDINPKLYDLTVSESSDLNHLVNFLHFLVSSAATCLSSSVIISGEDTLFPTPSLHQIPELKFQTPQGSIQHALVLQSPVQRPFFKNSPGA